jgi:hypothetical protein
MRLVLFDCAQGGHHPVYLRRFAEALGSSTEISVAAPDSMISELADLEAEMIPLGRPRPAIDERLRRWTRHVARRELRLLAHAAQRASADHVVPLYADLVLPRLATTPSRGIRLTTLLFYPRGHYPDAFGMHLPFGERTRAAAKEAAVAGWCQRSDAHAVMTVDEEAARRWSAKRGAPAYWVPELTVESVPLRVPASDRSGCILYGALADRKGIDLLARAIGSDPTPTQVTVAGEADPGFLPPALSGFAARFSRERFAEAVSRPFRDDAGAAVEQRPPATTRFHTPQA